jgi:DNA-binding transcriptional LysR family regulator
LKDSIHGGDLYAGLSLLRLQVFVAVADHGGLSAAAAYLDLAQPTISFHVKALEGLLGAKLLEFRHRRAHLTPAGQELYGAAVRMLRDAERLAIGVRNASEGQAGALRLGASIAFELPAFFEHVLAPFRRDHPGVLVSLRFGHSVRLAEEVLADQLDLAYVQSWRLPVGVEYAPLHHAAFVLMVARDHPLASRVTVTPDDVYEAGLIAAPIHSQEWPHYEELLRRSGLTRYRIGMEIDGVQARLLATEAGLGVMGVFVPPYAEDALRARLQPLRLGGDAPRAEFGVVAPQQPKLPAAAAEFAAWLRESTGGSRG